MKAIVYLELGEGNGGLITDISAAGLAVQAAMALVDDTLPRVKFQLPRTKTRIELRAQIAWKSESKKSAGLQFVDISGTVSAQIEEWIAQQVAGSDSQQKDSPQKVSGIRNEKRGQISIVSSGYASSSTSHDPRVNSAPLRSRVPPAEPYDDWADADVGSDENGADADARLAAREDAALDHFQDDEDHEDPEDRREAAIATQNILLSKDSESRKAANAARVRMKRYLVNDRAKILLHDFVSIEAQKLCAHIANTDFAPSARTAQELIGRLRHYEDESELLVALMSTGCYWGEQQHASIWAKLLERVANAIAPHKALQDSPDLRAYPGLLLLYAGGVAAVANRKYSTIATLLLEPRLRGPEGDAQVVERLNSAAVVDAKLGSVLTDGAETLSPLSVHLHRFLREPLTEFIPFDADYDDAFNRFEYLMALVWVDANPKSANLDWIPEDAPLGRFASEDLSASSSETFVEKIGAEILAEGKDWAPLRAGLLAKSLSRLRSSKKRIDAAVTYSKFHR